MSKIKMTALALCALLGFGACAPLPKTRHAAPQPTPGVDALYQLARDQQAKGRHDAAIAMYREIIANSPAFADAHNGLGVSHAAQGRYSDAVAAFRGAIAVAPQRAYLHNNLGYTQLLRDAHDEAAAAFNEAIRLEPTYARARNNLQVAQQKRKPIGIARSHPTAAPSPAIAPVRESRAGQTGSLHTSPDHDLRIVNVAPNVFELQVSGPSPGKAEAILKAVAKDSMRRREPHSFRLEVSNANRVAGIAKRVADKLTRRLGLSATAQLTDHPVRHATEIRYREGYASEAAIVASVLQKPASIIPGHDLRPEVDIRLVLGTDVKSDAALVHAKAQNGGRIQLAARSTADARVGPTSLLADPSVSAQRTYAFAGVDHSARLSCAASLWPENWSPSLISSSSSFRAASF